MNYPNLIQQALDYHDRHSHTSTDLETHAIEAIEIFGFSKRLQGDRPLPLPILADLHPAIAPPHETL